MENRNRIKRTAGLLLAVVVIVFAAVMSISAFRGWAKVLVYEKQDYAAETTGIKQVRIKAKLLKQARITA